MSKKLTLLFIILTSLVVLVFSLEQLSPSGSSTEAKEKPLQNQSWQLFSSTSWQVNKQANAAKQSMMFTKELSYQNESEISHFVDPFIIEQQPSQIYLVQSQFGKTAARSTIELKGNVIIQSLPLSETEQNKTLSAQQVFYNTETETLTSNSQVTLIQPGLTVEGVGLKADINLGRYEFFANVKTLYQPNQQNTVNTKD